MIGTILSIIIAFLIYFHPFTPENITDLGGFTYVMVIVPILFLLINWFTLAVIYGPLQKSEQNMTPRILDMFKKDWVLRTFYAGLIVFALLSMLIAIDATYVTVIGKTFLVSVWIILFGIAIDLLHNFFRRIIGYFNPFAAVKMFTQQANSAVQNNREVDLCNWIDALSEISLKSLRRTSPSLCNEAVDEIQTIMRIFLESSKSISHPTDDSETKALGIPDKVSFTLFYVFQRLEMIADKALESKLDTVYSNIITALGKIAINSAKLDITLTPYPLHYIGKLALKAMDKGLLDIGVKATLTLLEIAKVIINDIDVTYLELKDTYLSIISHLDSIAKETFRKDKKTNIRVLTQPFRDLKDLFRNPKVINHQDTPVIVQNIDRVLGEFDTLEMVLRTMPPLPKISEIAEELPSKEEEK